MVMYDLMSFLLIILHFRESTMYKGLSLHCERLECRVCRIKRVFCQLSLKLNFILFLMNIYYHKYYYLFILVYTYVYTRIILYIYKKHKNEKREVASC